MSIDWLGLNWEAAATMIAGFLAVGAALVVGLRQTDILRRQAAIQEAELRSSLFDRRYRVLEQAKNFIREILQTADDPSHQTQREFQLAMGEARFLFRSQVHADMEEIWRKWAHFHALKVTSRANYQATGSYDEGNPEREAATLTWFSERFMSLPDLFSELRLGSDAGN